MTPSQILALARGYPGQLWLACFGAYVLSQMGLALWSYALPVIRQDLGLTRTQIGLLTGGAFAIGGVMLVWLGNLADRYGRRMMMVWGLALSSLCVVAQGFATNVVTLGVMRAASLASGGLLNPITGALVTEEAPSRIRGLMTGLLQVGYPIGWMLASLLAVALLPQYGWRGLFIAGIVGLPFVYIVMRHVRESSQFRSRNPSESKPSISELLSKGLWRRTLILFVAQYLFVVAYGAVFIFAPIYFHEARSFDIADTATLVGLSNLVGIAGYVGAAWVGEFHLTRRATMVVWTLLAGVSFVVFLWFTDGYLQSMVAFSIMAIFLLGVAAAKFAYLAELFPTRLRATGIAFCGSLPVALGRATGPPLVGWLADTHSWNFAMFVGGAMPLFLAGILYLFLKPVPSGLDVGEVQRRLSM